VHALGVLDQPEYEVSFAEFERTNFSAVIAPQLLLVECSFGILEEIDVVFSCFFSLLLHVLDHPWHIEFDVCRQHYFCSVD
jgi:hypothetical protein